MAFHVDVFFKIVGPSMEANRDADAWQSTVCSHEQPFPVAGPLVPSKLKSLLSSYSHTLTMI